MAIPAPLVVPALKRHTATVIVAHGLGDSGAGWMFLAENWRRRNKFEEVSFIFPSAPSIPITINMGMRMPGWYDILSLSDINQRSEDEAGIKRSMEYFHGLIKQEMDKGIPSNRIVIGGFSQGGAMSLLSGLTSPNKLGGIFGLSCYLLLQNKIRDMVPEENPNKDTPIFMAHGDIDPVVRYDWGQRTASKLKEWGWKVDFKTYQGLPHSADPEEIEDLDAYLRERIPPLGDKEETSGSL
ncbi:Phospholipase/carboxylesterase [Lasiodiplodia theobromae]|uniref:Acyl-protein thioesterase 1 n=1 Tax=Lasiodiplodia theobromae TaxID=45133 RepID=A0A5N5D665_9PEZI|nr:Phospholipase/carboxylesterase [Lasiodiplodia theobromae]KAB2572834.1 Acyl-protein thioesterase 1 [Lasiodiplodia theobromae]KAF4537542.1 Phospholipase/carboxylesterase [Lasiodiplodia theobromae]KAF9639490.1 Phospholipase/carboxylesterase [Lasiodiplodia theobromae]